MRIINRIKAWYYNVPYKAKVWYNRALYLSKEERQQKEWNFIEIFNSKGEYIECPKKGKYVKYIFRGQEYLYKIVSFKNDNPYDYWTNKGDHINIIIRFIKKV